VSRRNPLNERYQKDTKPKGVSKRSAASAKPVRKSSKAAGAAKTDTAKKKATTPVRLRPVPDTDEYRDLRKKWWIALGVATAAITLSLVLTLEPVIAALAIDPALLYIIRTALSWCALGLVAFSWWIDFKQLRPMIRAHKEEQQ